MLSVRGGDPTAEIAGRPATTRRRDLFAGLESAPALLLAVSGGPDSMALLHLATRWREDLGAAAPRLRVATVDHGLRPEARDEALMVAAAAARLGLAHATLPWDGRKPSSRIQERARAARYALLADYARATGASAILTAHHADDQAETVLLRLGRGSGIGGLAGMRRIVALAPGLSLVRPLLGMAKADLVALCRQIGQSFAEDPSNADQAYARARLRAEAARLAALGLDTAALARLSRRMARADAALEAETARLEACLAPLRADGCFHADLDAARTAEPEIMLRLLGRAIAHVAPAGARVRLERLETLTTALQGSLREGLAFHATLGGARVALARDTKLSITRERARRASRPSTEGPTPRSPSLRPICHA